MFEQLKNLGSLMAQAQQIQGRMAEAREKIAELRVDGIAGGEMVRVEASGDLQITNVTIDPTLMESADKEMLEELICAATNQALMKAKDAAAQKMAEVTGDLNLPGLKDALSDMGLGQN